jgi:asparagine synthase (glutamine-hydrolysing)
MCGIAGAFIHSTRTAAARIVGNMVRALIHRGPDSQGTYSDATQFWTIGLGHTRLSILDLSDDGWQPMSSNGCVIAFNGEVYNFSELRSELEKTGYRFRSRTDTEVILAAYQHWGPESFARLRGMFAFAIWDESRQKLILARDWCGIKPLYFVHQEGLFLFASEVRALLATGLVPRRLDRAGVNSFLCFGSVQEPHTIIDGIRALPPGHYMTADFSGKQIISNSRKIAKPAVCISEKLSYDEAARTVRDSLHEAVGLHLVSDVPVGVFLSGGIDSSAIVALVSQIASEPPRTFSLVFENDQELSESAYSRLVAKRFGTDHTEFLLSDSELLGLLPGAFAAMDQPTMDGTNVFAISHVARSTGIKVALSGLGADELFGGYPSFDRMHYLLRLRWLICNGQGLLNLAALPSLSPTLWKATHLAACGANPNAVYEISRRLFIPEEVHRLMPGAVGLALSARCLDGTSDAINVISKNEVFGYMANTLLRDTDSMSMAHGLEVRVPFLDTVFAQYVMTLPGSWKGGGPTPKRLLIDALGSLIPEEIWKRPKRGFALPFRQWLHTILARDVEKMLEQCDFMTQVGLDPATIRSIWASFRKGASRVSWGKVWALYSLVSWCRAHGVTEPTSFPMVPESRPDPISTIPMG